MRLFELLNLKKFNVLWRALKNEPLPQIWRNLTKYLSVETIKLNGSLHLKGNEGNWFFNLDFAYISEFSNSIQLSGWYVHENEELSHTIRVNGQLVDIRYYRPDVDSSVGKQFENTINTCGFYFISEYEKQNSVFVSLIDHKGNAEEHEVSLEQINSIEHLPLARNSQYHPYSAIKSVISSKGNAIKNGPLISVIMPVYNVSIDYLKPCIESVLNQTYVNWELCICDDASHRIDTRSFVQSLDELDPRIKVIRNKFNQNISETSNNAISLASGEYICLLDHDDLLHESALYEVVMAIGKNPNADIIYSDEDKLDFNGRRVEPYYKPQYSKNLLLSNNYICHILVVKKSLGDSIGWFRKGYEGAQDHDLILRLSEKTSKILHIPKILYHWRKIEGSTALNASQKSYASKAGKSAIRSHLKRTNIKAKVKYGNWTGSYRINYEVNDSPKISIIIPFRDGVSYLKKCVSSIFKHTIYPNLEIVLVNNNSEKAETKEYLSSLEFIDNVRVLDYEDEFNYSKINNYAIEQCNGEIVLLLNNDIEVITSKWLTKLYSYLQNESVGAVGAHLLYEDNTNQHNGVVLGIGGVAGHAFKSMDSHLYHYFLDGVSRDVSGCTAACLMVRKSTWKKISGLDENNLRVAFNDVDFCLKIRQEGLSIIFVNEVKLYHFESKSRGYEDTPEKVRRFKQEENYMKEKWKEQLSQDPFYNPNLSLIRQDFGLNMEGVIREYIEYKAHSND